MSEQIGDTNYLVRHIQNDHLRWMQQRDVSVPRGGSVLDLGCSNGGFLLECLRAGASRLVGVDLVLAKRELDNRLHLRQFNLDEMSSFEALRSEFGPQSFDLITAFDILEHVESPFTFLKSLKTLLRPHGKLVVTTPNALSLERYLRPFTWSGAADPQHKQLFTPYTLTFLMERVGFLGVLTSAPLRKLESVLPQRLNQFGGQIFSMAIG